MPLRREIRIELDSPEAQVGGDEPDSPEAQVGGVAPPRSPKEGAPPTDDIDETVVLARAIAIAAEQFGVEKHAIRPETVLTDELGADILDILEFLMALEEELDVEVSGDVETIKTMQDVVDCVMRSFPIGP